jgi:hypothetical protein
MTNIRGHPLLTIAAAGAATRRCHSVDKAASVAIVRQTVLLFTGTHDEQVPRGNSGAQSQPIAHQPAREANVAVNRQIHAFRASSDSHLIGNITDHHSDADAITLTASVTSPNVSATAHRDPPGRVGPEEVRRVGRRATG